MRSITFPIIKGTTVRRNAETGVEIHSTKLDIGGREFSVYAPTRTGLDLIECFRTLAEARDWAAERVEMMREVIAEAFTDAADQAAHIESLRLCAVIPIDGRTEAVTALLVQAELVTDATENLRLVRQAVAVLGVPEADYLDGRKGPELLGAVVDVTDRKCAHCRLIMRAVEGRDFCIMHGWAEQGTATVVRPTLAAGTLVQFRPDFSDGLVGVNYEVEAGSFIDASNGRTVVKIRTKLGRRWNGRTAYADDLIVIEQPAPRPERIKGIKVTGANSYSPSKIARR